jgi:hypothetical protein
MILLLCWFYVKGVAMIRKSFDLTVSGDSTSMYEFLLQWLFVRENWLASWSFS